MADLRTNYFDPAPPLDESSEDWMNRDRRERARLRRMRASDASPDEVRAESVRLGLDIPLDEPTPHERNPAGPPREPAAAAQGEPPEGSIQLPTQEITSGDDDEDEAPASPSDDSPQRRALRGLMSGGATPEMPAPPAPEAPEQRRRVRMMQGAAMPDMPTTPAPRPEREQPPAAAEPSSSEREEIENRRRAILDQARAYANARLWTQIAAGLNQGFSGYDVMSRVRPMTDALGEQAASLRSLASEEQAIAERARNRSIAERNEELDRRMAAQRLAMQRRDQEADRALTERRVEAQERGLDIREQSVESLARLREARLAAEQGDAAQTQALQDPGSDVSRGLQDTMIRYEQQARGEISPQAELAYRRMPASVLMDLPGFTQMIQGSHSVRRGRGGLLPGEGTAIGRTGALRARNRRDVLRTRQEMREQGYTEEQIDQLLRESDPNYVAPEGLPEDVRDEVQEMHREARKMGLPSMHEDLRAAESALEGATDGDVREAMIALNTGTLGENAVALMNPRAAEIAQAVQRLSNAQLNDLSGAAVSDQEFARFKRAMGQGQFMSVEALRRGLQHGRRVWSAQRQSLVDAYPRAFEVAQQQRQGRQGAGGGQRGGAPRGSGATQRPQGQQGGTVRIRYQGQLYDIPRSDLDTALGDGAEVVQ